MSIKNNKEHSNRISINFIIPNVVTLMGFIAGFKGIIYTINHDFEKAIYMLILCSVFDFFDGSIAKLVRGTSNFGAELDSLSDLVSFGIFPSLMIYNWSLHEVPYYGWLISAIFAIATILRLARFNIEKSDNLHEIKKRLKFFDGVPSPAGAILLVMPITIFFAMDLRISNLQIMLYSLCVAFLMISKIPTLSFKFIKIQRKNATLTLFLICIFSALVLENFWDVLITVTIIYAISLPIFALIVRSKIKKILQN